MYESFAHQVKIVVRNIQKNEFCVQDLLDLMASEGREIRENPDSSIRSALNLLVKKGELVKTKSGKGASYKKVIKVL